MKHTIKSKKMTVTETKPILTPCIHSFMTQLAEEKVSTGSIFLPTFLFWYTLTLCNYFLPRKDLLIVLNYLPL